ncbi:hypothetical protein FE782_30750 [Paenibacillus antri]|uniref:DUF4025 domain-containing protein n=1 Tax=Paenibacillus antri TaxID=2582848 RepID=A0A5R9FY29_9BACL|nr:hypothetical protein [Paenibacillus antri]TLS48391.1 hypothetical protein FE782_30750 [Paenibacillus antri]
MARDKRNNPAGEALLASYNDVASGEAGDEAGAAETREQIKDDYFSGGNDVTFLRDGEDLGKNDGYRPT